MKLFVKILFVIEILGYLCSYIVGTNIHLIVFLLINLITLILYLLIKNKNILINKRAFNISIGLIFIFSIFSVVFKNDQYENMIVINAIKYLVFILNIYFTSCFIYLENEKKFFYKVIYLATALFLIMCYIINFDDFEGIKSMKYVFDNHLRYRESYGLYHYNATGHLCLIALVIWKFLKTKYNYKTLSFYGIINSIVIIILISTASRNSILCLILFYYGSKILSKISQLSFKYNNFIIARNIFCILLVIVTAILIFNFVNIQNIIVQTNRLDNYLVNIPTLLESKRALIGVGLIDEQLFINHQLPYSTTFIDNWFLYILLTLGYIGLTFSLIIIGYLGKCILKDTIHKKDEKIYVTMIFIISLFYSMFESCFLAPGTILSYVFWNIYFIFLFEQNNRVVDKN